LPGRRPCLAANNDCMQGCTHRYLNQASIDNLAREREDLCALAALGDNASEPVGTSSYAIGGDDYTIQHSVLVAFKHAAIHECAGIALVSITNNELAWSVGLRHGTLL
jgi:hypothetical protein